MSPQLHYTARFYLREYTILLTSCIILLWPDGGGAGAAERIALARAQEQRNNPRLSLEMRT